jgi:uncharacterized membrane protein YqgA involved in biofilm formation
LELEIWGVVTNSSEVALAVGKGDLTMIVVDTIVNQWFALTLAPAMGPKVSLVRLPILIGSGHVAGTRLQQNHGMNQIDREQ